MPVVPVLTYTHTTFAQQFAAPLDTPAADIEATLVEVNADPDEASWAGSYWSWGYAGYLETGDVSRLDLYRDVTIGGYPLVTDPVLVEDFYYAHGHVDFQEYYKA